MLSIRFFAFGVFILLTIVGRFSIASALECSELFAGPLLSLANTQHVSSAPDNLANAIRHREILVAKATTRPIENGVPSKHEITAEVSIQGLPQLNPDQRYSRDELMPLNGKLFYSLGLEFNGVYGFDKTTLLPTYRSLEHPYELLLENKLSPDGLLVIRELMHRSNQGSEFSEKGAWVFQLKNGHKIISFVSGTSIRISGSENENAFLSILESVNEYSEIESISFYHTHPGESFHLSPSDVKAAIAVNSKEHYLHTGQERIPVHVYATASVDGQLVTTHFSVRE